MAASGLSPYVSPLFIAQDPNFYWPLITDHGCIRAALEFVAPYIDWDEKIGTVKGKRVFSTDNHTLAIKGERRDKKKNEIP